MAIPDQNATMTNPVVEIAKVLREIPALLDRSAQATLVESVGRDLGRALVVRDGSTPQVHLYNIVAACHDEPGGLDAMMRFLDYLVSDHPATARVRALISPVQDAVTAEDGQVIDRLLRGRRTAHLARLFCVAAGGAVTPPAVLRDALHAFHILADHNVRADGLAPHLVFVSLLAEAVAMGAEPQAAVLAAELRDWLARQVRRMRDDGQDDIADRLTRLDHCRGPVPDASLPICVVIMVEPDLTGPPGGYVLSHWRQIDPTTWCPEPGGERIRLRVAEIPDAVAHLLQEAETGWARPLGEPLYVEFVLPTELLNLDVDQWTRERPPDPYSVPIGTEYDVVVRSQERLRTPVWHRSWQRRSRLLHEPGAECVVHELPHGLAERPRALRVHLNREESVVACLLTAPPDVEPGRSQLAVAMRAGLPVVLWCRDAECGEQLTRLLRNLDIRQLRSRIRQLRSAAAMGDSDPDAKLGSHITLLWDDQERFLDLTEPISV